LPGTFPGNEFSIVSGLAVSAAAGSRQITVPPTRLIERIEKIANIDLSIAIETPIGGRVII
jgi:hypothetical protein